MTSFDYAMNKASIVSIVSQYVHLRRTGREYKGLCPFHKEKTASFAVNEDKGVFYCFGCGESGDAITFVRKVEGLSFKEALSRLGIASDNIPRPPKDTAKRRTAEKLANWMNEQHLKIGALLRELSQEIGIAQQIRDVELVESLTCEWEILSDLHEDLQRPKCAEELLESKDTIEAITALAPVEPLPQFPEWTPKYRDYLAAAVKGELC
jgi:DNA primase